MADTKITKKPSEKVSLGSITKSGNKFSVSWKYTSKSTDKSKNDRFENVYYQWNLGKNNGKKTTETITGKTTTKNLNTKSTSLSISNSDYYPNSGKAMLKYVTFKIVGKNKIGSGPINPKTYNLKVPPVPGISKEVDEENGRVTFTIKSSSATNKPRTDTQYWVGYKRNIKAITEKQGEETVILRNAVIDSDYIWYDGMNGNTAASDEFTKTVNVPFANALGEDDWIKVICTARARGVAGASAKSALPTVSQTNKALKESGACHVWCWPAEPTITGIVVSGQLVIVKINTNTDNYKHITSKVELERATVDAGSVAPMSGYQSVQDAVDDGYCNGLSENINDATPSEPGKEVWYRVKATHDNYTVYSAPKKCPDLATAAIGADSSSILNLEVNTKPEIDSEEEISVSGTVQVTSCGFTKEQKNDQYTSNALVYSYAKLVEPQTYASLDFSSESILTDEAMGITVDKNGLGDTSWYIQNLDLGAKYVLRVCRALCSDDGSSVSIESRGKWAYYTISNENGVSTKLLDATPFTVPSIDAILKEYIDSDTNIEFVSAGSQLSGRITAEIKWFRGRYNILGNNMPGSDKSVLEYIKKGEYSWSTGVEFVDENDPETDPDKRIDTDGYHQYVFNITGLSDGDEYKIRFKRVLQQGENDNPPSSEISSEWIVYDDPTNKGWIRVFQPSDSEEGSDKCGIYGVTVDLEKESMTLKTWFENTHDTNGTQIMWASKYPPKTLTTGSFSSYDLSDIDLGSATFITEQTNPPDSPFVYVPDEPEISGAGEEYTVNELGSGHFILPGTDYVFEEGKLGLFSLIVDDLPKGDHIYLDARRFLKSDSNTSYQINYASGTRYSEQKCAWDVIISAEDDRAFIDDLSASNDGTTVTITASHQADDSDGIEISYSNKLNAWDTTKGPETYSMPDIKKGTDETRTISIPDLDPGTRYYFKVRRYMEGEKGTTYGMYSDVKDILTLYPVNQNVVFIDSIESEPDGLGLRLTLGWYDDSANRTEISYSSYKEAWISSAGADTFDVVDADWVLEEPGETEDYKYKATAIIRDLEEGVKYYIRARRMGDDDSKGVYSETLEAIPLSLPDSVFIDAPNPVVIGQDFYVSWSYQSIGNQTDYILKCTAEIENVDPVSFELSSGEGFIGSAGISWEDFSAKLDNLLLVDESGARLYDITDISKLYFEVSVRTGGFWVSGTTESFLAEPPICSVTLPNAVIVVDPETELETKFITSQPFIFSMETNMADSIVLARIESRGITQVRPDREIVQPLGDCIWTDVLDSLIWAEVGDPGSGVYASSFSVPVIDFLDNGSYILYVTLYNMKTGLYSNEVAIEFLINWAHQAVAPDESSRIDKVGIGPSIAITPVAPVGYANGDVCDIYRKTQDGAQLIYEGAEFGTTIIDNYPPYSMHINTIFDNLGDGIDLRYSLSTRTVDGDVDFNDFPYSLTRNGLSIDWDGGSKHLELPWNLNVSNSFEKDFENRIHMDGTVTGYWNAGSTKTGSFDTAMCKIDCSDIDGATRLALCRELATYTGPVFVRTPYGNAFCADVSVDISQDHNSPTATISLSYTEIDFVNEFAAVYNGDEIEEEEPTP